MDDLTTPLFLALALAFCVLLRSVYKAVSQAPRAHSQKTDQSGLPPSLFADLHKQIAEDPDRPGPWVRLAEALTAEARESSASEIKMHRLNEAVVSCRRALEIGASYAPAWRAWGQALFEIYRAGACREPGTYGEANAKFKEAADKRPEDPALRLAWSAELERCAFVCGGEQQKRFKALAETLAAQADLLKRRSIGSPDPIPPLPDMPGIAGPGSAHGSAKDAPEEARSPRPAPPVEFLIHPEESEAPDDDRNGGPQE